MKVHCLGDTPDFLKDDPVQDLGECSVPFSGRRVIISNSSTHSYDH